MWLERGQKSKGCRVIWRAVGICVVVYFIQLIIAKQYNIILYNLQNRNTERVSVEAKNAYIFLS